jgi:hypothetical protein
MSTKLNLKGLSLKSTGASHGVPYTTNEKRLIAGLVCAILVMADHTIEDAKKVALTEDEQAVLQDVIDSTAEDNRSLPGLVTASYKAIFANTFGEKAKLGDEEYPKLRDLTSMRLLLRGALVALGKDEILAEVPSYGKGTKKKA